MVTELLGPAESIEEVISQFNGLLNIFKAIGGVIIVWIIFTALNLWRERKRDKRIDKIEKDMNELKRKISRKR